MLYICFDYLCVGCDQNLELRAGSLAAVREAPQIGFGRAAGKAHVKVRACVADLNTVGMCGYCYSYTSMCCRSQHCGRVGIVIRVYIAHIALLLIGGPGLELNAFSDFLRLFLGVQEPIYY